MNCRQKRSKRLLEVNWFWRRHTSSVCVSSNLVNVERIDCNCLSNLIQTCNGTISDVWFPIVFWMWQVQIAIDIPYNAQPENEIYYLNNNNNNKHPFPYSCIYQHNAINDSGPFIDAVTVTITLYRIRPHQMLCEQILCTLQQQQRSIRSHTLVCAHMNFAYSIFGVLIHRSLRHVFGFSLNSVRYVMGNKGKLLLCHGQEFSFLLTCAADLM